MSVMVITLLHHLTLVMELKIAVDNILATFDEGKGGIAGFETFESDTVPKPIDFCYQKGDIATPDGDWEFVSKMYFKAKELEVDEYLDYSGKEIYRKDGTIIS